MKLVTPILVLATLCGCEQSDARFTPSAETHRKAVLAHERIAYVASVRTLSGCQNWSEAEFDQHATEIAGNYIASSQAEPADTIGDTYRLTVWLDELKANRGKADRTIWALSAYQKVLDPWEPAHQFALAR